MVLEIISQVLGFKLDQYYHHTFQTAAPLKMHFCNTFDGNSPSNFERRCDFFQLSEVAFWSGVLFEYI